MGVASLDGSGPLGCPVSPLRPALPLAGLLLLLAAAVPSPLNAQTLNGVVTDSISGGPLVEATVFLSGTQAAATSDEQGRVDFGELRPGRSVVTFTHPMLEEFGVHEGIPLEVEEAWVSLATPSFETVLGFRCAMEEKGNTAVAGVVRIEADALVRLVGAKELETSTDSQGRFRLREVPPGDYELEIERLGYGLQTAELGLERAPLVALEVGLPSQAVELEEITVSFSRRTMGEEIVQRSGTRRDVMAGRELVEPEERGDWVINVIRQMPGVREGSGRSDPS